MSKPLEIWLGSQKKWVVIREKKAFYRSLRVAELDNIIKLQRIHLDNTVDTEAKAKLVNTLRKLRAARKRKTMRVKRRR